MKTEKLPARMEYWKIIDDALEHPIIVGIEHADENLHGVLMSNLNNGKVVNLKGVEVQAIMNALVESGAKTDDDVPKFFHIA